MLRVRLRFVFAEPAFWGESDQLNGYHTHCRIAGAVGAAQCVQIPPHQVHAAGGGVRIAGPVLLQQVMCPPTAGAVHWLAPQDVL